VTNHGVSNAITLDFAVTMTNTVGSTVQHVGFPLKTGSGLASGEPAALIAGEQPVEPHLDLVSRDGELQLSIGGGPFKDGSLAIFDVAGRRVHSWQNIATGFSDKFLRADGLREGLYMVRFEWAPLGDGGLHIVSRKVMIAR
jgi:hypothetical protein